MPNIDEQEDFLRKKIDESTVDYSDQYWEQAKLLLDTKPKRKFGAWWLSAILLVSLGSAAFYFTSIKPSGSGQKIAVTSREPVSKSANSTTIVNTNSLNKKEKQEQSVALASKEDVTTKLKSTGSRLSNETKFSGKSTKRIISSQAFTTNAIRHSTKSTSKSNTLASNAATENESSKPEASRAINQPASNAIPSPAGGVSVSNTNGSTGTGAVISKSAITKNNNRENLSNNASSTTKELNDTTHSTVAESTATNETGKTAGINSPDTSKQLLKDSARVATIPLAVNKVDTTSVHPESKGIYRNKILSISAGCNFNKGINAGGNALNVGALPYLGVSYAMVITHNNRGMIQWGLQLNMNNHLNSQIEVHHSNYYSFGYGKPGESVLAPPTPVSDTVFTLNQQLIFNLQLPVVFDYYINGKNSFSIGAGIAYTLAIYNKVTNFNGTERNSFGYNQGYNPYAFLQAGYCYNFTRNWAVELTIQQGLTDITNNSFFKSNSIDRITNLQIGLKREFAIKSKKVQYDKK